MQTIFILSRRSCWTEKRHSLLRFYCETSRAWSHLWWCRKRRHWAFGHNCLSSQIIYNGFTLFPSILGTVKAFLRIVPHGLSLLWAQRRYFTKEIHFFAASKGNILSKQVCCAQYRSIALEIIGSGFQIVSPVPNCRKLMGNISGKFASVPKYPFPTSLPMHVRVWLTFMPQ